MAASMSPSKIAPRSISAQHRWMICKCVQLQGQFMHLKPVAAICLFDQVRRDFAFHVFLLLRWLAFKCYAAGVQQDRNLTKLN